MAASRTACSLMLQSVYLNDQRAVVMQLDEKCNGNTPPLAAGLSGLLFTKLGKSITFTCCSIYYTHTNRSAACAVKLCMLASTPGRTQGGNEGLGSPNGCMIVKIKVKCAILLVEFRRGAHLPS